MISVSPNSSFLIHSLSVPPFQPLRQLSQLGNSARLSSVCLSVCQSVSLSSHRSIGCKQKLRHFVFPKQNCNTTTQCTPIESHIRLHRESMSQFSIFCLPNQPFHVSCLMLDYLSNDLTTSMFLVVVSLFACFWVLYSCTLSRWRKRSSRYMFLRECYSVTTR